jgi:hypothetical protein
MPDQGLFRVLDDEETAEFRQWARANYQPLTPISGYWHPVIQDECRRMNEAVTAKDFLSKPL